MLVLKKETTRVFVVLVKAAQIAVITFVHNISRTFTAYHKIHMDGWLKHLKKHVTRGGGFMLIFVSRQ